MKRKGLIFFDGATHILNALVERGEGLKLNTFTFGFSFFFGLLITSFALLWSGPLSFIGIVILIPFLIVSFTSFFITPIVMSGIANAYMLQKRFKKISVKNFILGIAFCVSFWVIPYVGLCLWFILFLYCFGVLCEYIRNAYFYWKYRVAA